MINLINQRTSYRGKFNDNKIPREYLTQIMEAGLAAPSGCNKQTTSLIAVDDEALVERIKAELDPPVAQTSPAFICVLTEKVIAYRDRTFYIQDYSAAIENMLLATVSLGYQSCWYEGHITDTDQIGRKIADILEVPEQYELVCLLPIGIADERIIHPNKKPFSERAFYNGFGKNE